MTTAVFVCADDPGIDPGRNATAITGLCVGPTQLAEALGEAERVVLLLHQSRYDLAEVQKALRAVDIDPLGAQIIEVPAGIAGPDLEITIVGLRKRALAFAGSRPEHAKPLRRGEVTRRGLFKAPRPVYMAAPMVDHGVCAAVDGCRACADVCPQDAYKWHQGRIHYSKDVCEPCGRCVTACPTEAISNPAATPTMLSGQIRALVGASDAPIGVRFVCSRTHDVEPVLGWHELSVPCTGMIPGTWLIAALLMGAGAVTVASCSDGGCPLGLDNHSQAAIDFARTALVAAGLDPELIPLAADADQIVGPVTSLGLQDPFTRVGDVEVMLALDSWCEDSVSITHRGSSLGVVAIDSEVCTLCAQCAQTCPTDAIEAAYEGETVSLSFDAASCTNCNQCTIACPEIARGAISVAGKVDVDLLRAGRQTINEGVVLVCESCGKPIAPSSMMDRIGELLGDGFDDTMSYLTRRCMDCRGLT
ncbi:MAG: hydrogenase iron-sulfur subunit [bacterium]|nr:hydrogenase iron-sulfur subunit [bacterium]